MVIRDPSEEKIVEEFLETEGLEQGKQMKILNIIKRMGKFILGVLFRILVSTLLICLESYFYISFERIYYVLILGDP